LLLVWLKMGTGGFWRNAFDTAIDEPVQHDIANHQNTAALHG
jgi:hypothetical protein